MRTRIDIFPTIASQTTYTWYVAKIYKEGNLLGSCNVDESEIMYPRLNNMEVCECIEYYNTDSIDVDLDSNPSEARYIHYRKL